jgi:hypothetical protein
MLISAYGHEGPYCTGDVIAIASNLHITRTRMTHLTLSSKGKIPRYPLNKEFGRHQSWSGSPEEIKLPVSAENRLTCPLHPLRSPVTVASQNDNSSNAANTFCKIYSRIWNQIRKFNRSKLQNFLMIVPFHVGWFIEWNVINLRWVLPHCHFLTKSG